MLSFILSFFHLDIVSLTCKAYFVLANCSYPRFLERPFCYWLKLIFILKTVFLNYLFVLLYLLYSVFNEHLRAKHFYVLLVGSNGLEPSTSRLSGARSSLLSYEPMYHRRLALVVEMKRFELSTSCVQGRRSPNWATPPCFESPHCFPEDPQNWTTKFS